MYWLPILIIALYYATRYIQLKKHIKASTLTLMEIVDDFDNNRRIKLKQPDKDFEMLLSYINRYIDLSHHKRILYENQSDALKKDMEHISHDLRTPLTSIQGYIELMKDASPDEMNLYKEIALKKAKGLENLLHNFYEYALLEDQKEQLTIEPLNLKQTLTECLLIYYHDFESRNINVSLHMPEEPVLIKSDKNYLTRIFSNLIQNACKYSISQFKLSLIEEEDKIIIHMENDTVALTFQEKERLFDRFYMRDETRNSDSSGLGLTITKHLVETLDGLIEVMSKETQLIFTIKFKK